MKIFITGIFACMFMCTTTLAQDKANVKFGKVSVDDFAPTAYEIDSSAHAVIIAEIGSSEMTGNNDGGFNLDFKTYRRARIMHQNGYDIAEVTILYYVDGTKGEDVSGLKASTYNLENGKVVETKLEAKSAVFTDNINKNWRRKKFTFPNIKPGSIIEYEYKINSEYIRNLREWEFQGEYPVMWGEYNVTIPEFYYYVTLFQGYLPFHIKSNKGRTETFRVSDGSGDAFRTDRAVFDASVVDYRWVIKNAPALKEESYTSSINNHISKIEFQLAETRHPFTPRNIMGSWKQLADQLLASEEFGMHLKRDNGWLSDVVDEATKGKTTQLEKAKAVFAWVRDNLTCTNHSSLFMTKNLKNVLKLRSGSEAEVNLLLTAMLIKLDLRADPVLLSTRQHGYAYDLYPLLNKFNYVISRLELDGRQYLLDASRPSLGFGKLSSDCYNGHARVINDNATAMSMYSDSLSESSITSVFLFNDEKNNLVGSYNQLAGYNMSYRHRNTIKQSGTDNFFATIKKGLPTGAEMKNSVIDSLKILDEPVAIKYEFTLPSEQEDLIYFNPMMSEAWKENPFKSAVRYYPVEMPYKVDETYLIRMDIPAGYEVDELPKQMILRLNEDQDGVFEYRIEKSGTVINLRSRLKINRSFFLPEEYEMLREFFNIVVKKHAEQIVFKKKSGN